MLLGTDDSGARRKSGTLVAYRATAPAMSGSAMVPAGGARTALRCSSSPSSRRRQHELGDDLHGHVGGGRPGAIQSLPVEQRTARVGHDGGHRPAVAEVDVEGERRVVEAADVVVELAVDLGIEHEAAEPEPGEHGGGVGADRCGDEPRGALGQRRRQRVGEDLLAAPEVPDEVVPGVDGHGGRRVEHVGGGGEGLVVDE